MTLEIPKELKPKDGRFGCGPSKVRTEAFAKVAEQAGTLLGTSHRQAPVRQLVKRMREGLSSLFSLPEGYEVVLGNGGATCFWDIATFCLIQERSQHLSFGEFSSKFASAAKAAPHLADPVVIKSDFGTHPEAVADESVDVYAFTHNETSTGVAMEIKRPLDSSGKPASGLVLVDATSGAGGLRFDPREADAYYFAPQKSFGSDGGLFIAVMSPAAIERSKKIGESGRFIPAFLDLNTAIDNSRLDQTYNTPSIVTMAVMAEQIDWFNENGGLEWAASRSDKSAEIIYGWAENSDFATPFAANPKDRSHVVATIDFADEIDASQIAKTLRQNGIVDTEPYRKLGRNQLRVAMFPGIDPEDIEALTGCVDYIVKNM